MSGDTEIFDSECPKASGTQTEADGKRIVDGGHGALVQPAHPLAQTGFVYGAYLLKQYDAVPVETYALGRELDVGRQACLPDLAGYGGGNNSGAVLIAGVVLHDKDRTHAALLAAHDRA